MAEEKLLPVLIDGDKLKCPHCGSNQVSWVQEIPAYYPVRVIKGKATISSDYELGDGDEGQFECGNGDCSEVLADPENGVKWVDDFDDPDENDE